jgi:MFS family permease
MSRVRVPASQDFASESAFCCYWCWCFVAPDNPRVFPRFQAKMTADQAKERILLVLFGLLPEAIFDSTLIPLFPFIVRHLLPNEPESNVGYYTGILGSSFYMPLFIMNVVWGAASDRVGRKPILLIGMLVSMLTTLGLGLSLSFPLTLGCRVVAGLFGANSTIAKGMIGDISRDQRARAWGYAMYGSVYGLSGILGPLLGGLLANPVVIYPNWFAKDGFFDRYPYLLVCALPTALSIIAIPLSAIYIKNSAHSYTEIIEDESNDESMVGIPLEPIEPLGGSDSILRTRSPNNTKKQPASIEEGIETVEEFHFFSWNTMGPILLYMTIAYTNMNYMTSMPLFFSASPKGGGVGMNSRDTALQFTMLAMTKLSVQFFLFDRVLVYAGSAKKVYRFGMLLYLPAHACIPILSSIDGPLRALVSAYVMISFGVCESLGYLSVILMITESQKASNLGLAHGLASTCSALVRALCPTISGVLWEWGVSLQWPWLVFYSGFMFALMGVISSS